MENEEISKYLSDKICPETPHWGPIDLFSPEGFFILWNWATKQDWWDIFLTGNVEYNERFETFINQDLINPEAFALAIYNYLKESE